MRGSDSDRALICPASLVLPRSRIKSQKTVDAADYGTAAHHWVETGEIVDDVVLKKVTLSGIRRHEWWPREGKHEVAFALHLFTLELRKYDGPREGADAWKRQFDDKMEWLTGTVDYIHTYRGRPWTDDFKSGKWPVDYRTKQVASYQLVSWVDEGCPTKPLYYRSITQWPQSPLDALPTRVGLNHPVTGLELKMHLENLRWAVENPDECKPEPIDTGLNPDGTRARWDPDKKLSICAFCPCRVEIPMTPLMHNYRWRSAPHCMPGMIKRLNEGRDERSGDDEGTEAGVRGVRRRRR
jgi:hypothetical protein